MATKKTRIGLTEKATVIGSEKEKEILARIDTGADICSIDKKLAKRLKLGPVERIKKIKSSNGIRERPIVRAVLEMKGRRFIKVRFSLADRNHLRYKMLIGKNNLKRDFLIDPSKK